MHEDDRAIFREDDVGFSRQVTPMEPEPKPEPVKRFSQGNLRLRIGGPDARHPFGPLGWGKSVDHSC